MPTAPDSPELIRPVKRSGRMSELAAVEEVPVWLEVNGRPVVTWMCTPDLLEELAIGWLHGEGYIDRLDEVHLRPCATDLGFWAEVPAARVDAVQAEGRRPVLASGCGAVSTFLAEPATVEARPPRGAPAEPDQLRTLFKALFARSTTRVEYLSLLTGRPPPGDLARWRHAPIAQMVAFVDAQRPAPAGQEELRK